LSETQKAVIRERYARGGVTQAELAREHGVSQAFISMVISGKK
jgi:predicted transcriptional regulator